MTNPFAARDPGCECLDLATSLRITLQGEPLPECPVHDDAPPPERHNAADALRGVIDDAATMALNAFDPKRSPAVSA